VAKRHVMTVTFRRERTEERCRVMVSEGCAELNIEKQGCYKCSQAFGKSSLAVRVQVRQLTSPSQVRIQQVSRPSKVRVREGQLLLNIGLAIRVQFLNKRRLAACVLIATISDVQAWKRFSLFTRPIHIQCTKHRNRLQIGLDNIVVYNVRNEKSTTPHHTTHQRAYVRFGADPPSVRFRRAYVINGCFLHSTPLSLCISTS